ncbi:hypothetical protein [Sphingomonas panacis]|uniref:hypothetical protein n=1 Tax=Sphingomonas panacis TaxID=1560345 RepID=UPI001470ED1B|nr:hypothetical protein [Sphingomonas panacis]
MRRTPSPSSRRPFIQVALTRSFSETARLTDLSQLALSRTITDRTDRSESQSG